MRRLGAVIAACLLAQIASGGQAAMPGGEGNGTAGNVRESARSVGQYEKVELSLRPESRYGNPFDSREVEVVGLFRTPSDKVIRVPGFYCQAYRRSRDEDGNESLSPNGGPGFRIRFAWGEVGRYQYHVTVRDRQGERALGSGVFNVVRSASKGYVRRSADAAFHFQFDSGAPYFAIGENMCWPGEGGTYNYDLWMPKLAAAGGNYIRLWLNNEWNELGLEHLPLSAGDGNGLGRYDQAAAWRIDYLLALAERLGIKVLMCIESFNSLSTRIHPQWERCVYNRANGGPCARPGEFFTNAEAKRAFEQRLRYLVARWGYSSAVLAWEFWNEVDLVDGYDSASVAAWHQEMARHLRRIDPWAHLITTSFANTAGDPAVDGLAEMDFVQSHSYGAHDVAEQVNRWSLRKAESYGKPHYFGEFGVNVEADENASDPEGIHLHNGLWAAMLSGDAGTAMLWWWDCYVEPRNLYHHFAPVAAFAADIDWVKENYSPAAGADLRYAGGQAPSAFAQLLSWFYVSYRLPNYVSAPSLRVLALRNLHSGLVWVQNKDHTWWNHRHGVEPQPVPASEIEMAGFEPGEYEIEEWDTYAGRPVGRTRVEAKGGKVVVRTPAGLTTDVAYKIRRAEGAQD